MKDWEKRNAEEMVEGLVGMTLEEIEMKLGELSNFALNQLGEHLTKRYKQPWPRSFAGILQGLCVIEAGNRLKKGGGGE